MDTARLAAIRAREQAATPGPWFRDGRLNLVLNSARFIASVRTLVPRGHGAYEVTIQDDANAVFIAAARADVPDLLAEVERLQTEIQDMRLNELARLGQEMGQWEPDYPIHMGEQIRLVEREQE